MLNGMMLIVIFVAFGVAISIAGAGPGTQLGLWEYGTGIAIIRNLYFPSILIAIITSLAFVVSLFSANRLRVLLFFAAAVVSGAAIVPYMFEHRLAANPFIHDITTDFEAPPQITAAANLDRKNPAAYDGAAPVPNSDLTVAEAQRSAFPDIKPVFVSINVDDTARKSRDIIKLMKMKVLSESTIGSTITIEATYKSRWFGFIDDFIVRIQPDGDKARVDIRSKSRVGVSDLGANAQRVRNFVDKLVKEVPS